MIASSAGEFDLARLLLDLLVVVGAAKLLAEIAERLRVPSVVGEIIAGVVVGPSVLGLVSLDASRGVSIGVLAEIGVLLLLMQVGMEMDLRELGSVGSASLLVAVIGVALPFAGGAGVALALGLSTNTAVFVGAALTATSVGITARVFGDLRALATPEARVVLGAAVADDVLGLVILTVVVKVVSGGSVGVGTVFGTLGLAVAFLLVSGAVGLLGVPRLLDLVDRRATSPATVSVAALAVTLAFAQFADLAHLAFIIGAFMAGLAVGTSRHHERVGRDLGAVGNVLVPVFFAQIGINADLGAMFKPSVLGIAAALSAVAVLGKLASAIGVVGTRADRLLVGLGMIPRGEVGLIFASIGLGAGVLDTDQYGALLLVVLVTTLATPPLLRWRLGRSSPSTLATTPTEEPPQGWLTVDHGSVRLHGTPPTAMLGSIAVGAAALVADARPSTELLDWFAATRESPVAWDRSLTPALVRVLRRDDARAWRLLEETGVLERALPEVAAAMRRRRADLGDLDPLHALRFPVVDRLAERDHENGPADDTLLLAAFVADVCGDRHDETGASALARRLVTDAAATRVAALVADAWLLRSGISSPRSFEDRELLQLATHLASPSHARSATTLAVALGPLRPEQREALQERLELVVEALDHPEVTGGAAADLAAARRLAAERLLDDPAPIERLRHAPTAYLLDHEPAELARQARLIEPLPRRGDVRVAVTPDDRPDHWRIDVACRDHDGLLARLTDVLTTQQLDIATASIATWGDGGVIDSFLVRGTVRPSARGLGDAFEQRLRGRLRPVRIDGLEVSVDSDSLPWHSSLSVTGPDRPGALRAVSTALALAGVVVHSAHVGSTDGRVDDRFAVTDRFGRRLDAAAIARVRAALDGRRPR